MECWKPALDGARALHASVWFHAEAVTSEMECWTPALDGAGVKQIILRVRAPCHVR